MIFACEMNISCVFVISTINVGVSFVFDCIVPEVTLYIYFTGVLKEERYGTVNNSAVDLTAYTPSQTEGSKPSAS
jgi:hypothetical protein